LRCSPKIKAQHYRSTPEDSDFSSYPANTKNFSQSHERLMYLFFLHLLLICVRNTEHYRDRMWGERPRPRPTHWSASSPWPAPN